MGRHNSDDPDLAITAVLPPVEPPPPPIPLPDHQAGETWAALQLSPGDLDRLPLPMDRPDPYWWQRDRALRFLLHRAASPDLVQRAAHILRAKPGSPELEQRAGGVANREVEGQNVKCSGPCRRRYVASPEDPYLNAATRTDGTCAGCLVLAQSRTDDALPVLTGTVVTKPRRGTARNGEADGDKP